MGGKGDKISRLRAQLTQTRNLKELQFQISNFQHLNNTINQ